MLKFQSFLSSSGGNCTFVTDDTASIIIDCGSTLRYLNECLNRLRFSGSQLDGIFVTHEHIDHIRGIGAVSRKFDVPVYANASTWEAMDIGNIKEKNIKILDENSETTINTINVRSFSIPHDAASPVGYRISDEEHTFCIATDMGYLADNLFENLNGCDFAVIEANHDVDMLKKGSYPYYLKQRILGKNGHLSNDASAQLCSRLVKNGTKAIWLGHLSNENNLPKLAYNTVLNELKCKGLNAELNVIPKYWIG